MTKIIGISGISGAGTTTITKALGEKLNVTTLYWDDFDDISESPADYVEWFHKSGDYADWKYPALEKTLKELKSGRNVEHPATRDMLLATPFIIFDSSLGRKHEATARFIDLLIHLDTSMDVALARRLIRDNHEKESATVKKIVDELQWYLQVGRPLFDATNIKQTADFLVNGDLSKNEIIDIILKKLKEIK